MASNGETRRTTGEWMKKIIYLIIAMVVFAPAGSFAVTKIDPAFNYVQFTKENPKFALDASSVVRMKTSGGQELVGSIIRVSDIDVVSKMIEDLGGVVKLKLKTIITADIPLDIVDALSTMDEVLYIEADKRVTQKMNVARNAGITNIATVQGTYTGTGVVVGIVDSGVDCTHADFTDRIIAYWDMDLDKKYTQAEITAGTCYNSIDTSSYHGTHVAGIAAGADPVYTGVASTASIAVVQLPSTATETDVLDGVDYVFEVATGITKPAVANLSIGTSLGSHDGTSNFETGILEAVSGKQGRSIVCAAGNETVNTNDTEPGHTMAGLHAAVNVSGTNIGYETIIRSLTSGKLLEFDIWLEGGRTSCSGSSDSTTKSGCSLSKAASSFLSNCGVELIAYDSSGTRALTTGEVLCGATGSTVTASNLHAYVDFSDSNNANNGMQHAQVFLTYDLTGSYNPLEMTYDLVFHDNGGGCRGNVWIYPDLVADNVFVSDKDGQTSASGSYVYSAGDNNYMTTIPSTSTGCISVASFASRGTWTGQDGEEHQDVYNADIGATGTPASALSLYSSWGPGAGTSNTQKPDITTPGEPIISTLTGACDASCQTALGGTAVLAPDGTHIKLEGTSMASPIVTGTAALLLQKNGCLTYSEVKSAMTSTATTDSYTSTVPNYKWGYGKLNAEDAANAVTASACQPSN